MAISVSQEQAAQKWMVKISFPDVLDFEMCSTNEKNTLFFFLKWLCVQINMIISDITFNNVLPV